MRSRKCPIALMVFGMLLALGPLWGLLGTVVGMIGAFGTIGQSGTAKPDQLASNIGASLSATAIGIALAPIGLVLLVGGIVWIVRVNKQRIPSGAAGRSPM